MSIIDILTTVLTGLYSPALTIYHGSQFENNFTGDNATFPAVFIDEPIVTNGVIKQVGISYDSPTVRMYFCDKIALVDATPAQQKVIIDAAKAQIRTFLNSLSTAKDGNGRKYFNVQQGLAFTITDVINLPWDVATSGARLEIQLPLFNYDPFC